MGLLGLYASSCVLLVQVADLRRSSPGLVLGLLVLPSHDIMLYVLPTDMI